MEKIEISELNKEEAKRYLGYNEGMSIEGLDDIFKKAEEDVLKHAQPRYTYRLFDITHNDSGIAFGNTNLVMSGQSITEHLKGCKQAILMCATVSEGIDRIIKQYECNDMARAMITDALGSVAVEQVCERFDDMISRKLMGKHLTFRFGIGYGDLSLSHQKAVLSILEADKRIGVSVTKDYLMIPRKSVSAVIGVSDEPIEKGRRGCAVCNMRERCNYKKKGLRCNE